MTSFPQNTPSLLDQYDRCGKLFVDLKNREIDLLAELIKESNLSVHSITGTVRERDELGQFPAHDPKSPQDLLAIKDLVIIRIITYFEDEVEHVSRLIHQAFKVSQSPVVDREPDLDLERFGYPSRRYQIELLDDRTQLIEYRRFIGIQTQVHILSVLQHAWAEMAQRLMPLNKNSLPAGKQRAFFRIAGLLELADEQFNEIKTSMDSSPTMAQTDREEKSRKKGTKTEAEAEAHPPKKTETGNTAPPSPAAPIAAQSQESATAEKTSQPPRLQKKDLVRFVRSNPLVVSLDKKIQDIYSTSLRDQEVVMDRLLDSAQFFQITTVQQLESQMIAQKEITSALATHIFGDPDQEVYDFMPIGISVALLFFALAASSEKGELIAQYVNTYSFLNRDANEELIRHLATWYRQAIQ